MTIDIAIILTPFIFAALIPVLHRFIPKKYIGWIVFIVSLILFSVLTTYIPRVSNGEIIHFSHEWIPSLDINGVGAGGGCGCVCGWVSRCV